MNDPIKALLDAGVIKTTLYAPNSRYHSLTAVQYTDPAGQKLVYLPRRFIAQPEAFALLMEHTIEHGDRGDLLAARYLGDPELAWRLYDANVVFDPTELTARIGLRVRITLPAGIPAPEHE
jgi:hypothetical protein